MKVTDSPRLMQSLTATRKRPRVGDLFVLKLEEGFLSGRVIATDATFDPSVSGLNLLYIYRGIEPVHPNLQPRYMDADALLIPPVITNNQGWLKGYFYTIGNVELTDDQLLPQHCFRGLGDGTYWDEYSNKLARAFPPVGVHALDSYLTIENEIALALGKASTLD